MLPGHIPKTIYKPKMTGKVYRPDIDGLRALAVLGVILFHAGLPIPGGYVGVDVFFVISGYLISKIIVRESSEGRFSFVNFWVRRVKRIIPASALVTMATICAACFVLEPRSLVALGKSAIFQAAMLSNVYFSRAAGYFSESSELQPLLHTWSLAVEEQFYLIFPLLLVVLLKRKQLALPVIGLFSLASLILSAWAVYTYPTAAFYLLPSRAWELSAGALLAISETRVRPSRVVDEVASLLGLALILVPMFLYSSSTPFPGLAAVAPVLGAVACIGANRAGQTIGGRLLANKLAVGIGLVSYSLYLWHWPILVLMRHMTVDSSLAMMAAALGLTGVLSYISWRFVEVPFRSSVRLSAPWSAFAFGAVASGAVVAAGLLVWSKRGIPSRFDSDTLAMSESIYKHGSQYANNSAQGVALGMPRIAGRSSCDFVLWGDSHGMSVAGLIDRIAKEQNLSGLAFLSSGRPPIPGLWKPGKGPREREETLALNEARYDAILRSGTANVILVGRWTGMFKGLLATEIDEKLGRSVDYNMVVDSTSNTPSYTNSRGALERQLSKLVERFARQGVRVWVLVQVPSASRGEVARDFYLTKRFPRLNPEDFRWDTSREKYAEDHDDNLRLFMGLSAENFRILDPLEAFYPQGVQSLLLYSNRAFYGDEDHLTTEGADHFLRDIFSKVLREIKEPQDALYVSKELPQSNQTRADESWSRARVAP